MAHRNPDAKQKGVDILVQHDLRNVLEGENAPGTAFWVQQYVGTVTKDGPVVNPRIPEVVQLFENAGFTVSGRHGKPYKGDEHSNVVQNLLVALAKGDMPNLHSLKASPQANAELDAIKHGAPSRKSNAAYKL